MTQLEHAPRRTTVLVPALVAAAVSATISLAGIFYVVQPTLPTGQPVARPATTIASGIASGRIWEAQRKQQSVSAVRSTRAYQEMLRAGAEWQLRYEQTKSIR